MSAEEHSQILQTIEMFEAITQTQPDDYQSLEILRQAYTQIGRQEEALRTTRKLAEAFFNAGLYTPALHECESILTREPNAPEILAMLGEIEARLQASGQAQLEAVLSALIDRTRFAYVPLEYYDTDRQIAPMLPEFLTLGRLFVPFDLVSRTIMVACCNPFDSAGREAVQQSVDYTISWYLARPSAISKSLQAIYRLEGKG